MARISNRAVLSEVQELRGTIAEFVEAATPVVWKDPTKAIVDLAGRDMYSLRDVKEASISCYEAYHANPTIRRAVDVKTQYVWGRGVTIDSNPSEVMAVVADFLERNDRELGHHGRMEKEKAAHLTGNLFLMCSADAMGAVTVRTIPLDEIIGYTADPDDSRNVWYWKRIRRVYTVTSDGSYAVGATAMSYHPALGYDPDTKPTTIEGLPVEWKKPILHAPMSRVGYEVFAMPSIVSALPWGRAYTQFLSNIASINAALARFAWKATAKTVEGAKLLAEKVNTQSSTPIPTASTLATTEGMELRPIQTAGVTTTADEGRRFALMISSGTDVPEHILMGDPSTGNLATTKMMERPFELSILDRQRWWEDALESIITFAVEQRVKAPGFLPLDGEVGEDDFGRRTIRVWTTDEEDKERRILNNASAMSFDATSEPVLNPDIFEPRKENGTEPEEPTREAIEPGAAADPAQPPSQQPPMPPPNPSPSPTPLLPGAPAELMPPVEEPVVSRLEEAIVVVTFPSILEHDMGAEVAAIIDAATLKGLPLGGIMDRDTLQKLLISSLNVPDVEDTIKNMDEADLELQRSSGTPRNVEPQIGTTGGNISGDTTPARQKLGTADNPAALAPPSAVAFDIPPRPKTPAQNAQVEAMLDAGLGNIAEALYTVAKMARVPGGDNAGDTNAD